MDYNEDRIRRQIIAGLKNPDPWRVELEEIDHGARLGVFYRSTDGVKRAVVATRGHSEDRIAFALLSELMNAPINEAATKPIPTSTSPYEGRRGKHPRTCTCSKHKAVDGAQAA